MANPNSALTPTAAEPLREAPPPHDPEKLAKLLARAAKLAAEQGLPTEVFMDAAWAACLESRPGLREELEVKALTSQLRKLRKQGLIGQA